MRRARQPATPPSSPATPLPLGLLSVVLGLLSGCDATWNGLDGVDTDPGVLWPEPPDPVADVNVFVGTGGPGFRVGSSTPAATTPFGLVKLGPDTALDWGGIDAQHCSGYFYDDTYVDGFSHVHLHGTGVPDYGDILVMPLIASEVGDGAGLGESYRGPDDWRDTYTKENESAKVGYYALTLDSGVKAELTASPHAGFHRYTFPSGQPGLLAFDLEHVLGGGGSGGEVTLDAGAGTVSGSMLDAGPFTGGYGGFRVYFYAELLGGYAASGTWSDGADVGAWVMPKEATAELRVGISLVSVDGAQANLRAEDLGDFDSQVDAAQELWQAPLSQFELLEATDDERALFYTSAYHLLQMPTDQSDVGGEYVGFDHAIHERAAAEDTSEAGAGDFYSDMSLWDTYRTANPAYILFYPGRARDFAQSLVTMSEQGTALPRWPAASGESACMLGNPADTVLAETAIKGITGWDEDAGYQSAVALALGELTGTPDDPPSPATLEQYGYLPSDLYGGSVSWTQEVAWADNAIANWASHRGDADTAAHFAWRSRFWRNQWDADAGFFHGRRSDGTFDEMPGESAWADEYVEGDAWQYLWLAAQPAELAEVMGGEDAAKEKLGAFFDGSKAEGLIAGPAAYYWQGNEPDLHAAFLFALWGAPDDTLLWQRWIEDQRYANAPDGLAGNDDAGTLAAWYMFSTLGFYPLSGTDLYVIATPRYPAARFQVGDGWFTVIRVGEGAHVASVELDGVPLTRPYLHHSELTSGRTLTVRLE